VLQESGYALRAGKKLMLFREVGVELPSLQGDLEYIPYDPDAPDAAWGKALAMLTQLIAENAGIEVGTVMSTPQRPWRLQAHLKFVRLCAASLIFSMLSTPMTQQESTELRRQG